MTRYVSTGKSFRRNGTVLPTTEKRATAESISVLTLIGAITSQVVLITAAFYYFGWVYTHSYFEYFGVDTSLLGYSTTDYVLRSITVAYDPFIYLTFAALALFGLHRLLMTPALMRNKIGLPSRSNATMSAPSQSGTHCSVHQKLCRAAHSVIDWTRRRPGLSGIRRIIGTLQAIAVVFVAAGFAGKFFLGKFGVSLGLFLPLSLMLGVSLLGYVTHVRSTYPDAFATRTPSWSGPLSRVYTLVLLTLGLAAGLWAVSIYGAQIGNRLAISTANELPSRPGVVVYSTERIALGGPGINATEIYQSGAKYHFQYTGLRFLARVPDKFLLLPARWQHGHDRVFLVRDDNSVRIDIETW